MIDITICKPVSGKDKLGMLLIISCCSVVCVCIVLGVVSLL